MGKTIIECLFGYHKWKILILLNADFVKCVQCKTCGMKINLEAENAEYCTCVLCVKRRYNIKEEL